VQSSSVDIRNKKKIALVLSGGGIKAAAYHIGVCLALQEKGFRFAGGTKDQVNKNFDPEDPKTIRLYVGSSAGAFVSSILASGYSLEALIKAFQMGTEFHLPGWGEENLTTLHPFSYRHIFNINGLDLVKSLPRMALDRSLIQGGIESLIKSGFKVNGLFNTKGIERYLRKHVVIENDFRNLGVDLFIIGTQLNHSRKAIFGPFEESSKDEKTKYINYCSISDAVAASTSLPPVFAPYPIQRPDGKTIYFFDGEIRDTLSTHVAADHGADLVISSYSVQPYHYSQDVGSLHRFGVPVILNQALYQVIQQKIDKHIEYQKNIETLYSDIRDLLAKYNWPLEKQNEILELVCSRTGYKPAVDYIYVHPSEKNYQMFFVDHFSLNTKILGQIVTFGFKSCLSTLKQHGIT
jgi:predicted acylesterase/phospholipase RssA